MMELRERRREITRWLEEHRHDWPGIVVAALRQTLDPESSLAAAAISYFALFSFFPLLVLTTAIAGTWLEPVLGREEVVRELNFIAPALGYLLERNLQRIVGLQETITGIALVSLLWSSSSIFYVLTRTLDKIWGVHGKRSFWQHRGVAVLAMLGISVLLLLASVAHSTLVSIGRIFAPLLAPVLPLDLIGGVSLQALAVLVNVLLFATLYRFLPHASVGWRDVWPGALGAGLLWEVVKRVFFFYATNYLTQPNLTALIYGSVATIVGFMAWSYVSSLIFLFGAYATVGVQERRRRGAEAGQR